jgi:cytochrome c oxidase subunit 1
MFWTGLHGMNRRIATYSPELQDVNVAISIMGFILGASFVVFVVNIVWAAFAGEKATADPWRARTLEWQVPSPPPLENFPSQPVVTGGPYDYGVPGAPAHGILAPAGASGEGPS